MAVSGAPHELGRFLRQRHRAGAALLFGSARWLVLVLWGGLLVTGLILVGALLGSAVGGIR